MTRIFNQFYKSMDDFTRFIRVEKLCIWWSWVTGNWYWSDNLVLATQGWMDVRLLGLVIRLKSIRLKDCLKRISGFVMLCNFIFYRINVSARILWYCGAERCHTLINILLMSSCSFEYQLSVFYTLKSGGCCCIHLQCMHSMCNHVYHQANCVHTYLFKHWTTVTGFEMLFCTLLFRNRPLYGAASPCRSLHRVDAEREYPCAGKARPRNFSQRF